MDITELSKIISHALRHEPAAYNIKLSSEGWVEIEDLVNAIKLSNLKFSTLTSDDLISTVDNATKKRHEVKNGKIRALYGHSMEVEPSYIPTEPPEYLYHGTTEANYSLIRKEGLNRMERQYVHLSLEKHEALRVANRKKGAIIILIILAKNAFDNGIDFYQEGNVWLSKHIPSQYISNNQE